MTDQQRRPGHGLHRLVQIGDVISQPPGMQMRVARAQAVTAQTDRVSFITVPGKPGQKVFIPDPGVRKRTVDEQQRRRFGCGIRVAAYQIEFHQASS